MNDSHPIPIIILLFKYESEASPVYAFVLGIKAGKVIFDDNRVFVNLEAVVQGISMA
jgi:hypothetical protein